MALHLRAPRSERPGASNGDEARETDDPGGGDNGEPTLSYGRYSGRGRPLGAATSDWDQEDAARNPAGPDQAFDAPAGATRRWMRGGFGLLALAGFVGVLWYAYQWGLGGGETVELPTVTAEAGPEKVKPSDPGGLQVPYQDQLVLNEDAAEAATPQVERLLPPPEVPELSELAEIAPSYDEPVELLPADGGAATELPETSVSTVPELPAAPSAQAAQDEAAESEAPAEPAAPEPEPEVAQPAEPAEATQTAAAPAAAPAEGDFAVQLVSLKDKGAAEKEWTRLKGLFPDLLGDKSLLLQSAEVAGVGQVFRLRAGPLPSRAAASKLCDSLKSKQQDCLVVSR